MRIKFLVISVMLFAFSIMASAQDDMFDKFSKNKDITTLYISKTMLKLVPSSVGSIDGVDIKSIVNKIDQLEIYTTQKKSVSQMMLKEAEKLVKEKTYEDLMLVKEGNQKVSFLVKSSDGDVIKEVLMYLHNDGEQCTLIRMEGNFTVEDIQNIMNNSNQSE